MSLSAIARYLTEGGLTVVLVGHGMAACSPPHPPDRTNQRAMPPPSIEEVLLQHNAVWMSVHGVVGTAIGSCDGVPCIKILVAKRTAAVEERIPASAEGYLVRVEVTGSFQARDSS